MLFICLWIIVGLLIIYLVDHLGLVDPEYFWTGENLESMRQESPLRHNIYLILQIFSVLILIGLLFRCFRGIISDYYTSPFEHKEIGKSRYQTKTVRELYQVVIVTFVLFSSSDNLKAKIDQLSSSLPRLPGGIALILITGIVGFYLTSQKNQLPSTIIRQAKMKSLKT